MAQILIVIMSEVYRECLFSVISFSTFHKNASRFIERAGMKVSSVWTVGSSALQFCFHEGKGSCDFQALENERVGDT
jgi:hypothetical protein